jgi:hypothetical protein
MVSQNLLTMMASDSNPMADAYNNTTKMLEERRKREFEQEQAAKKIAEQEQIDAAIRGSFQPQPQPQVAAPQPQPAVQPQAGGGIATPPAGTYSGAQQQPQQPQQGFITQNRAMLQQKLAQIPGGSQHLMAMQQENDKKIERVVDMAAAGDVAAAQFFAKQHGINIPQEIFANGDFAKASSLAAKLYPDEADKAQRFAQAFMANPNGDIGQRAFAAMKVAGTATNAAQRTLNNQIALLKWKAANPSASGQLTLKDSFRNVSGVGLVQIMPDGSTRVVQQDQGKSYNEMVMEAAKSIQQSDLMGTKTQAQIVKEATDMVNSINGLQQGQGGQAAVPAPQQGQDAAAMKKQQYVDMMRAKGYSTGEIESFLKSRGL